MIGNADLVARRNLYWYRGDEPAPFPGGLKFADWQAQGFDQDSLLADPLLVDPDHDTVSDDPFTSPRPTQACRVPVAWTGGATTKAIARNCRELPSSVSRQLGVLHDFWLQDSFARTGGHSACQPLCRRCGELPNAR